MADGTTSVISTAEADTACFCKHEYSVTIRSEGKCAECMEQVPNFFFILFSSYYRLRQKNQYLENVISVKLGKPFPFNEMMLIFIYLM